MTQIDWSKAGKRLRHTPRTPAMAGRNPDWNDRLQRWKVAEEYAGESLSARQVEASSCPRCGQRSRERCYDANMRAMDAPHAERVFAAGAALIAAGWVL